MVKTGQWLSEGWEMTKANLVPFIVLMLIVAVGGSVTGGIISGPLMVGFFYIIFRKMRDPSYEVNYSDVSKGFEFFVPALLAMLISGIFIEVGFVLCIVPGFIVAAWYLFIYPLILEKKLDFWQAMETSRAQVSRDLWAWVGFVVVAGLVYMLGAVVVGVGILVTGPIVFCALAAAYRDTFGLEGVTAAEAPAPPVAPGEPPAPPATGA